MALRVSGGRADYVFGSVDDAALVRRIRGLPKELQSELRKDNLVNSRRLAGELMTFRVGFSDVPPQAALVAKAIYPKQDRLIRVDIGGPKRVGWKYEKTVNGERKYKKSGGARAGQLLYGSEFGSKPGKGNRFQKPHKRSGYWIGPTVAAWAPDLVRIWRERVASYLDRVGAS